MDSESKGYTQLETTTVDNDVEEDDVPDTPPPGSPREEPLMDSAENEASDDDAPKVSMWRVGLPEGTDAEIDPDVYGATIFVLAFDLAEILTGVDHDGLSLHINIYRVCFVNLLLFGNYFVQGGLLYWIYRFVALPQVQEVRTVYQRFHAEVFRNGDFDHDLWMDWEGKYDVCNICFSNFTFMYTILALWWITMLIELNKTFQLLSKLCGLRHVDNTVDMLVFQTKEGYIHKKIVGLTTSLRTLLIIVLIIPKSAIALILLVVGTVWLAATDSVVNLILNAIALNFVIGIDENLFDGFIPESMRKNIDLTKLYLLGSPEKNFYQQVVHGYARSTMYVIVVMAGVFGYMVYGQSIPILGIFPGFDGDVESRCAEWWAEQATEVCTPGVECFPKG